MNLSAPFIQRPVMTTFIMLTIIMAGVFGFLRLPVNDLPTIEYPRIWVTAKYAGASPDVVFDLVTVPLERELSQVKGVNELSSSSSSGRSSILMTFNLNKNMDEAIRDVQAALAHADALLPQELTSRPSYHYEEDSPDPIIYLLLSSEQSNIKDLRAYADAYIIPRLRRIEGVASVKAWGSRKSIWIRLNPELMALRQIGFNEVINTIKQQTARVPLGSIQTSSKALSIEWPQTLKSVKDLENLQIGNASVRIKDIGEVLEESKDKTEMHLVSQEKNRPVVVLAIAKVNDANTVKISKDVGKLLSSLQKELPPSNELSIWFDKANWIEESLLDVQWSLLFAFGLVALVIYFSLGRLSESLIISIALPLSILGTFAIMYAVHFSLDLLSLLALTLSVGFVVDDAIVVLENIVRHQEKGALPREASLLGSKQICFTILSMTLSLVAVFIPLLFMPGMNGRLFREFSLTLAIAILVSGFVSLTLTPLLCSRFLSTQHKQTNLQRTIASFNARIINLYAKTLKVCFRYHKSVLFTMTASIIATFFLFIKLPVNLIPPEDRGYFLAFVNLPSGMETTAANQLQNKIESLIHANVNVKRFLSIAHSDSLLFIIHLHPIIERLPQQKVIDEIRKIINTIPGTQAFVQPYQLINLDLDMKNPGQYKLVMKGLDFAEVEKAANRLSDEMQSHAEFSSIQSSIKNDSLVLTMHINEELAHQFYIDKQDIQYLLQYAYSQVPIGTIQRGGSQQKIFMELLPEYNNYSNAPAKLYLRNAEDYLIPFKAIADWKEKLGPSKLIHRDLLPSASIRFSLANGIAPNEGLRLAEKIASEVLPNNVSAVLVGAAKAVSSTTRDTLLLLLAATLVMYIVLGILYESFIHPLTVLSSIPFAGLGGVLTLFLFDEPISIFSAVGFLLLIGIVKKNGIMMVDYALEAQRQGASAQQAVYEACLVRFRPILMTTFAAIMGAIPIAISMAEGAEMRRGLGLVIVGGLLFSQVLTLYATPVIYLTFEKLSTKIFRCCPKLLIST